MGNSELKDKTAKGLFWGGFSNGIQQVLSALFGIALARILSPGDYGMVGMLALFTGLANSIQEGGFISALTNKRDASDKDYNAVFWFNIFVGLSIYIILYCCAPMIAKFFNQPDLLWLSRILFLSILIGCFGTAQAAYLFKNIMAKERAKIDIISLVVSNVAAIIMAYNGMSYWGIAIQTVLYILVGTLLRWLYSPWRPTFKISFEPLRSFWRFSIKLVVTNIFTQTSNNVFNLLLGKFYSVSQVGYYSQGNKWMNMGSNFTSGMISGVAQPVLAQISDDKERESNAFHKMVRFIGLVSFPLLLGLALVSEELIIITVTDKWLPSVRILQILCIWGAFIPISALYRELVISHGKSSFYMYFNFALCIVQILVLVCTIRIGIYKMVIAFVLVNFISLICWQIYAHRLIGIKFLDVMKDIAPYLTVAIASLFCGWRLSCLVDPVEWKFVIKVLSSAIVYCLIMYYSKSVIFRECLEYISGMVKTLNK